MGFLNSILKMANSVNSFESVKDRAPNEIGVYIMSHDGKVKYIGRAIEDRFKAVNTVCHL